MRLLSLSQLSQLFQEVLKQLGDLDYSLLLGLDSDTQLPVSRKIKENIQMYVSIKLD